MKKILLIFAAAVVLSSCATMPKESPILELDNITLDGDQWIKVQNIDKNTGKPIANAKKAVLGLGHANNTDCGHCNPQV